MQYAKKNILKWYSAPRVRHGMRVSACVCVRSRHRNSDTLLSEKYVANKKTVLDGNGFFPPSYCGHASSLQPCAYRELEKKTGRENGSVEWKYF